MTPQPKAFRELIGLQPSTASVQDSILNRAPSNLPPPPSRAAISTLLSKYRAANAPLIHIIHHAPPDAPIFTPGTPLAQEFQELTPKPNEKVITKQHPGSFTGTELDACIKETGKSKVVVTGYMAHVCVSTTARQAAEKGYDVVLVGDAIGDRDIPGVKAEELVKTVLAELADAFGTVVQSGDIN